MKLTDFDNSDLICLRGDDIDTDTYKVFKANGSLMLLNLETKFYVQDFFKMNRDDWKKRRNV